MGRAVISVPVCSGSDGVAAEDVRVYLVADFGWEKEEGGGGLVIEGAWGESVSCHIGWRLVSLHFVWGG